MSSRTIEVIENDLDQENKIMFVHQKNGNYGDAEKSRLKIEQLEKEHEERALYDMRLRHKKELNDLLKNNQDTLAAFNDFWNKNEDKIKNDEVNSEKEMLTRHKNEQDETRKELEVQYSPKVKETSELLNLRKMEEHMVKQKMYPSLYSASQRPKKFRHRSLRWKSKRRLRGWPRETKESRLRSTP